MGNKVQRIYVGENLVRPTWKPGENTLLYLPLESDVADYSGNSRTVSSNGVTFTTVGGVQSAHVGTTGGISISEVFVSLNSPSAGTVSCWVYVTIAQSSIRRVIIEFANYQVNYFGLRLTENDTTFGYSDSYSWRNTSSGDIVANKWINVICTADSSYTKLYVNGVLKNTITRSTPIRGNRRHTYPNGQYILCSRDGYSTECLNGNASNIIFESVARTAEEVQAYYNQTKSTYGL